MNSTSVHVPSTQPEAPEDRTVSIQAFVGSSAAYYERQFDLIGSKPGFVWTFNPVAAILGPILTGYAALVLDSQRLGVLAILVLLIAGFVLLTRVREVRMEG